jgi:hypothetical protein
MAPRTGVTIPMLEIHLPQVFPTMTEPDILTIKRWYVQENDIVQPGELLLEVEAPIGDIDIPTPPELTTPHRVISIVKTQGSAIQLGDLLLSLEPV